MAPGPGPAPPADRVAVLRLLALWLGLAAIIVGWGTATAPGAVVELGRHPSTVLFAQAPAAAVIDVWVRWDGVEPAWVILEEAAPWPSSVEPFWRRRVHPGWNLLVWDEIGALSPRRPVSLRVGDAGPTRWAVGSGRAGGHYGFTHLRAFRGLAVTFALVAALSLWTVASLAVRVVRRGPGSASVASAAVGGPRPSVPGWAALALIAIGALALLLRWHTLAAQSLWLDEVLTAIGAQSFAWVLYSPEVFGHPPLQYLAGWLAHFVADGAVSEHLVTTAAVAASDVWLRAPFVAAGVGTVVALGWLGCRLMGTATGVIAALVLAISPFHVELSQTARPYAFLLLLTVLSLQALVMALRTGGPRWWLWFTALGALAFYTHYLAIQVLALEALLVGLLLLRRRGRGAPLAAVSLAGLVVLIAPWAPVLARVPANLTGGKLPGQDLWWLLVHVFLPQFFGPPPADLLAVALLAWALWSLRRRRVLVTVLTLWLILPLGTLWLARPQHFIAGRHLAFVLPVALLVMASGVASAGTSVAEVASARLRRGRVVVARAVFVLVALPVVLGWAMPAVGALRGYYWWRGGVDWRTVASVLESRVPKGDRVIATAGAAYPLRYYWDDRVEEMDTSRLLAGGEGAGGDSLWIVTHEGWDRPPQLASWLERHAIRVAEVPASWSLPGVRVYWLARQVAARAVPRQG